MTRKITTQAFVLNQNTQEIFYSNLHTIILKKHTAGNVLFPKNLIDNSQTICEPCCCQVDDCNSQSLLLSLAVVLLI